MGSRGGGRTTLTGDPRPGGRIDFRFGGPDRRIVVDVLSTTPDTQVVWRCVEGGPAEWTGTTLTFDIAASGDETVLRFAHAGWREPVEFMAHCSTKWAYFLSASRPASKGARPPRSPTTSTSAAGDDGSTRAAGVRAGPEMDDVFRALADPSRRELLDRLNADNGQTLRELCAGLDMARQSVSKHLAVLEAADLVVTLRRGREKLHYLNAAPINHIAERWINHYDQSRVHALSDLKHALEGTPMTRPSFVYKTYINTTPEQLWQALTDPAFTQRYWDTTLESTWEVGATITWNNHGVVIADPEQVVLEYDPYRRLAYTWHTFTPELAERFDFGDLQPKLAAERRSRVAFDLETRRFDGQADGRPRRLRRRQHRGRHGERGLAPRPVRSQDDARDAGPADPVRVDLVTPAPRRGQRRPERVRRRTRRRAPRRARPAHRARPRRCGRSPRTARVPWLAAGPAHRRRVARP